MLTVKMKRYICCTLVLLLTTAGVQASAQAALIGTQQVANEASVEVQRDELQTLFARDDVVQKLSSLGVDVADAQQRVANLSNAEVAQLHEQINDLPAGAGALGTIALVLLILILLDVAGVTDIFPKI
jgi:TolA-binding protein